MSNGVSAGLTGAVAGTQPAGSAWRISPATWLSALLILALWLALRPYMGIVHDARFYAVQALHILDPAAYDDDLYFRYGSQDQYSLFSNFYARLIALLGLAPAVLVLTIVVQGLWLAALACLARSLLADPSQGFLAIALAIALPSGYGGFQLFQYGEHFLTPRPLAEALSMFGLALLLSGRRLLSWPVLLGAVAVHPLLGWPAVAVAVIWMIWTDRRWLVAPLAAVAAGAALAALGVQPMPRLLQTFDAQWLGLVEARSAYALIREWSILDLARALSVVGLALATLTVAGCTLRRFVLACLAVGLSGLLVALLAGDLARDILVVQVQPWRSLWILTLAANLAAGPLVQHAIVGNAGTGFRVVVIGGLAALVASRISHGFFVVPPFLFLVGLPLLLWDATPGRLLARGLRLALTGGLVLISLWLAGKIVSLMKPSFGVPPAFVDVVFVTAILGVMLAVLWPSLAGPRSRPFALIAVGIAVLAASAWDRRSEYERFLESDEETATLSLLLPKGAQVYWDGGAELLWLKLRRPSYFSCIQGTGGLFVRATAIEYQRRLESFRPLHGTDFEHLPGETCPSSPAAGAEPPTSRTLAELCGREPGLDYLVLNSPVDPAHFAVWQPPAGPELSRVVDVEKKRLRKDEGSTLYFYRCRDFRS